MERPLDRHAFLEQLQAQKVYEHPLEEGVYLGFFVSGDRVLLSRIENLTDKRAPIVVSCPVARLFR